MKKSECGRAEADFARRMTELDKAELQVAGGHDRPSGGVWGDGVEKL